MFYKTLIKAAAVLCGACFIYSVGEENGKDEGKKEGYNQASKVYEKKFKDQVERFYADKENLINNIKDKDGLIKEFEEYIEEQEKVIDSLSEENKELLYKAKNIYEEIKIA